MLKILLLISTLFFITACGGQSGGLAPSKDQNQPTAPIADISYESNFRFAESKTTGNGWEVTLDTTDPVEHVALGNGWTVEVMHE